MAISKYQWASTIRARRHSHWVLEKALSPSTERCLNEHLGARKRDRFQFDPGKAAAERAFIEFIQWGQPNEMKLLNEERFDGLERCPRKEAGVSGDTITNHGFQTAIIAPGNQTPAEAGGRLSKF